MENTKSYASWSQLIKIQIDSNLLKRASDLAEYGKLLGHDSIRLAAASRLKLGDIHNLQFMCFYQELLQATSMLGFASAEMPQE